jgi:CRISPR-associated protein Cmr4
MFKQTKPLFFVCETPLHAGSGSDLGIIDLPIQRERHTSFPKIEGSSFKGALREAVEKKTDDFTCNGKTDKNIKCVDLAFGPEEGDGQAGALGFSDARLLLFPVKSVKGVFGWVTCPKVLEQFKRDMSLCSIVVNIKGEELYTDTCVASNSTSLKLDGNKIVLEEYAFSVSGSFSIDVDGIPFNIWLSTLIQDGFWSNKIINDIVILSNDDFKDFVNLSTEVITRTKIDNEKGTVQGGALFTEEYLPAESVMYSLVMASSVFMKEEKRKDSALQSDVDVMNYFINKLSDVIQIGGSATLGKGIVRLYKSLLNQKEVTHD